MGFTVAFAGKGGTGKTTLCGLLILTMVEKGYKPILAVDADANANLNEVLGVEVNATVGEIREAMKTETPIGMTKEAWMEYRMQEALVECDGFDLIVMGRPEGPGCYCYANSLIRKFMEVYDKNYPYIVMDNEAGMEHLSRLTTNNVDSMVIVSDPSKRGLLTVRRICDLVKELNLDVKKIFFVINRVEGDYDRRFIPELEKEGVEFLGEVPRDPYIEELDAEGKPFTELPGDAPSRRFIEGALDRILHKN